MDELPRLLLETHPLPTPGLAAHGEDAFLRWRLGARCAGRVPRGEMTEPAALTPTPPLLRGVMTSERFLGRRLGEWRRRGRPIPQRGAGGSDAGGATSRARLVGPARTLAPGAARDSGGGAERAGRSRLSRHAPGPGLAAGRGRPRRLLRRPVRLDLPGFLDRAVRLRGAPARRRSLRDHARREASAAAARRHVAHGRGRCRCATSPSRVSSPGCARRASRSRARVPSLPSISSSSPTASIPTSAPTRRPPGRIGAATARVEGASSTGGGRFARSERAATSPTSAGASAVATATWSSSTPTA